MRKGLAMGLNSQLRILLFLSFSTPLFAGGAHSSGIYSSDHSYERRLRRALYCDVPVPDSCIRYSDGTVATLGFVIYDLNQASRESQRSARFLDSMFKEEFGTDSNSPAPTSSGLLSTIYHDIFLPAKARLTTLDKEATQLIADQAAQDYTTMHPDEILAFKRRVTALSYSFCHVLAETTQAFQENPLLKRRFPTFIAMLVLHERTMVKYLRCD